MIKQMQTAGEILKNQRRRLGKTVFEVSQETRIQEKYVKAIEQNDFKSFDSPVFAKGFMKIYAEYLGLDAEKIIALYRRQDESVKIKSEPVKTKKAIKLKSVFSPTLIIVTSILLVLVIAIAYLYAQFSEYQKVPSLEISQPQNGITVNEAKTTIKGSTSTNSIVKINGEQVNLNGTTFEKEVALSKGANVFTITSANPNNQEQVNEQIINVTYEEAQVQGETNQEPITTFSVYVKVMSEPAWIQLNVDGKQKYAQILNPQTTKKITGTKNLEYVTGKPNTTKLYINGKEVKPNVIPGKGTATLSCELLDQEVICATE